MSKLFGKTVLPSLPDFYNPAKSTDERRTSSAPSRVIFCISSNYSLTNYLHTASIDMESHGLLDNVESQ